MTTIEARVSTHAKRTTPSTPAKAARSRSQTESLVGARLPQAKQIPATNCTPRASRSTIAS